MKFVGYHEDSALPVKRGDTVTIKKGTIVKTMYPGVGPKPSARTYKVKIDHILGGCSHVAHVWDEATGKYVEVRKNISNPSVRWPGRGGYWMEVDINDLPEANS